MRAQPTSAPPTLTPIPTDRIKEQVTLLGEPSAFAEQRGYLCPDDRVTFLEQHQGTLLLYYRVRLDTKSNDCTTPRATAGAEGWIFATSMTAPSVAVIPTLVVPPTSTPEPAVTERTWEIGDTIPIGDLRLTVVGSKVMNGVGDYAPGKGKAFLVTAVKIENVGSVKQFIDVTDFKVIDSRRVEYTPRDVPADNMLESHDVSPGNIMQGGIVYVVPQDASGLELQFTVNGLLSDDIVHITLDS